MRTTALTAALSTALLVAGASGAAAATPDAVPLEVHCDNGEHYEILTNGMGTFTPGNIVGSTSVVVPVWFGATFTVETPGGVVEVMEGEADAKGDGHVMENVRRDLISCSFSETFVLEVEEMGYPAGSVVTFTGEVLGFVSGR